MMHAEGMTRSAPAAVPLEMRGRSLVAARLVWAALVFQAVILFAVSIRARYNQLSHPPADVRAQLTHAGLSSAFYVSYLTAISCVFALVCCAVAGLIAWHRPNDRIGLLGSLYLVLLSVASPPQIQAVVKGYPVLAFPANLTFFLFILLLVGFFFLFPDGRIVPRRARIPVLACVVGCTLPFILTGASVVGHPPNWNPPGWFALMTIGGGAAGIAAQIYRYIKVSDPVQRQQTKWVALGVSAAMAMSIVFALAGQMIPTIGRPETGYDLTGVTTLTLAFLAIPLTLGFAMLRYRLWDVDLVINRTLVYGTLTVGLSGLYLAIAGGLATLVQGRGSLLLSLVAAGLVAVLFAPLRGYLQSGVNRLMYGERDDPYRVLTRVGEGVSAALAPEDALHAIAETVAGAVKSPYVAVALKQGDTSAPAVTHGPPPGEPLHLPLQYQGATVGALLVAPRGPGEEFSPADLRLLDDLARQIGPAAHAVRLTADLQRSRERLVSAREEERRRLRRDLHDGLGPQLAAIILKLETARNRLGHDSVADALLRDLAVRTEAAVTDIRRLVYALRPPALDDLGLKQALREVAEQYGKPGITIALDAPESLPQLPAAVEVAAYRIAQEALTNVIRHAEATRCTVQVVADSAAGTLSIEVQDNGCGVGDTPRIGVGLTSMRERAEELGGTLTIRAMPRGGTCVSAQLPLSREEEERSLEKAPGHSGVEIGGKQTDEAPHG